MDRFIIMIIVLVPWIYTHFNIYEIVHIRYVQSIIAWQFYLNKALKIVAHKNMISIHFRKLEDLATLYWLYYLTPYLAANRAGYVTNAISMEYRIYLLSVPIFFLPMQQWT